MRIRTLILIFLMLIATFNATVLINSYDGRDVITGTYYAAVKGDNSFFVPDESTIEMIISKLKPIDEENITLINGKKMAMPNIKALLESKGYFVGRVINSDDPYETNLELAEELKDSVSGYILVSPSIGYNAIAPIPFARHNKYYLIFAESSQSSSIKEITQNKNVLVYGFVDDSITSALESGNINVINKGDKYLDDIEIVKFLLSTTDEKQVILTDGNFLEYTIMNTKYPILYISSIVPASVKDFLKEQVNEDKIKVALVIGQEYINTAYNLKKTINQEIGEEKLSVFAKLGETYPSVSPKIYPSPIFILPAPHADISVDIINYNKDDGKLTIVLSNKGNSVGYFTYSVKLFGANETISTFGSEDIVELKPGEQYTIEKSIELNEDFEGTLSAEVTLIYGTSKSVLDIGYDKIFNVTTIVFKDTSQLRINKAKYYPDKSLLVVELSNIGDKLLYYKITIKYDEEGKEVEVEDVVKSLEPGKSKLLRYDGMDIISDQISIVVEYGAKEYALKKKVESAVEIEKGYDLLILSVIVIVVVLILAYLFAKKRKPSQEKPLSENKDKLLNEAQETSSNSKASLKKSRQKKKKSSN